MNTQKILGLDLGPNSIGWALTLEEKTSGKLLEILDGGSRIIPMDGKALNEFSKGGNVSKAKERRDKRGPRRGFARYRLRRDNLKKVVHALNILPKGFEPLFNREKLDFEKGNFQFKPFELFKLRSEGLTQRLELDEIARIWWQLLGRRGFKSNRKVKEEGSDEIKSEWIFSKIISVNMSSENFRIPNNGELPFWIIEMENGDKFETKKQKFEKLIGKSALFEVKKPRHAAALRLLDSPDLDAKNAWASKKLSMENRLTQTDMTPGALFYQDYLTAKSENRPFEWRVRENIIERHQIMSEFDKIWEKQLEFHPILIDKSALKAVLKAVLPENTPDATREDWRKKTLQDFIRDYVIFHQRPIRFGAADGCELEKYNWTDGDEIKSKRPPVCPSSHPIFQEFRIWKEVHNIRLGDNRGRFETPLTEVQKVRMAAALLNAEKLEPAKITDILELTYYAKHNRKKYISGAETICKIRDAFKKHGYEGEKLLENPILLDLLWHKLYSITEEDRLKNALQKPLNQWLAIHVWAKTSDGMAAKSVADDLPTFSEMLIFDLCKIDLGEGMAAYSKKAIEKITSLMRVDFYKNESELPNKVAEKVAKFRLGELDDKFEVATFERLMQLASDGNLLGLQEHDATALLYGDKKPVTTYETPAEMRLLKQHSLRNPVVESIVNETLKLVRDVWTKWGEKPAEIRVELARDLRNNSEERGKIFDRNNQQDAYNKDVEKRVNELFKDPTIQKTTANPSKSDFTRYRLWLETHENSQEKVTKGHLEKFKLWEEAEHLSPYTGEKIPLARLFTRDYDVEHIVPKSLMYNNGFNNKTIAETTFNKLKEAQTAFDFIQKGGIIGKSRTLPMEDFKKHVATIFKGNQAKQRFLMMSQADIPDDFVSRQLNETRYISKKVVSELEKVVGIYNVKTTIGIITDYLREQWGINNVMKNLQRPRYEQMEARFEELQGLLITRDNNHLKLLDYSKRNDHRHHALDALVIACTQQKMVKRLNDLNKIAQSNRELLQKEGDRVYSFDKPHPDFYKLAEKWASEIVVSIRGDHKLTSPAVLTYKKRGPGGKIMVVKIPKTDSKKAIAVRGALHKDSNFGLVKTTEIVACAIGEAFQNPKLIVDKYWRGQVEYHLEISKNDIKAALKGWKNYRFNDQDSPKFLDLRQQIDRFTIRKKISGLTENEVINIADAQIRFEILQQIDLPIEHCRLSGKRLKEAVKSAKLPRPKTGFSGLNAESMQIFNQNRPIPVHKVRILADGDAEESGGKVAVRPETNPNLFVEKGDNYCCSVFFNPKTGKRIFDVIAFFEASELNRVGENPHISERGQLFISDGYQFLFPIFKLDTVCLVREGEILDEVLGFSKKELNTRLFTVVKMSNGRIYFRPIYVSQKFEFELKGKSFDEFIGGVNGIENLKLPHEEIPLKQFIWPIKIDRIGHVTKLNS